jgi:hypothetical protein
MGSFVFTHITDCTVHHEASITFYCAPDLHNFSRPVTELSWTVRDEVLFRK